MTDSSVRAALRVEAEGLAAAVASESAAAFARPSPCPPWTVGDLLYHVRTGVARLSHMLAESESESESESEPGADAGGLVTAAGYFSPDHRFSPATNADRIASAQHGAAGVPAGAMAGDFERTWHEARAAVQAAPADRVVRTRHGDLMLLTDFMRTRVLELAVHGLDLAAGLDRAPWLSPEAASVVADLVLPDRSAASVGERLAWDHVTMIAKVTGRQPLTPAESSVVEAEHICWLALG
ncbi:MAG: maleylpyruvate isomerase N-terminal domain-containing protein [Streptosporangiaceae bacterium]